MTQEVGSKSRIGKCLDLISDYLGGIYNITSTQTIMNYTSRFNMEMVITGTVGHPEKNIVQDNRKVISGNKKEG